MADTTIRLVAAGLLARRAISCHHLVAQQNHRDRLRDSHRCIEPADVDCSIVVPLYQEQPIVESTVAYWTDICRQRPALDVVLVTTAKETAAPQAETTSDLVRALLDDQPDPPAGLRHLHTTDIHRYRAIQINSAIASIRRHSRRPPEQLWVGIYNADSRPDPETFDELPAAIAAAPEIRAFQQLARYELPPPERPAAPVMTAFAAQQNWWTFTSYAARQRRGLSARRRWANTSPFSTFGHGEFFRLDLLDDLGGFPDFAYADGLLIGWLLRFGGEPIGQLASLDHAEVPRRPGQIVGQHRAWIRGLLNVGAAAGNSKPLRGDGIDRTSRAVLLATHRAIPALWGLRPAAVICAAAWTARRPRQAALLTAALLAYVAVPQMAVVLGVEGPGGGAGGSGWWPLVRRHAVGVPVVAVLDGLGFWPALWDHLTSDQAPGKTPR